MTKKQAPARPESVESRHPIAEVPAISCRNLGVEIPIYHGSSRSFRTCLIGKMVGGSLASERGMTRVKALEDISFEVARGASVGILGHNGAGKSTLLNVLAGIYTPTSGTIDINGETTPFFGMEEGIENEMTGYEVITVGGLVRGLHYRDLPRITKDIEAFTELGEFLNLPIRTYSAGMYARLTFAIATCVPPEILLVDENIGAGDERFQSKVRSRIDEYIAGSGTFFLASHDTKMLSEWCEIGLLLRHGKLEYFGEISQAIRLYDHGRYSTNAEFEREDQ